MNYSGSNSPSKGNVWNGILFFLLSSKDFVVVVFFFFFGGGGWLAVDG